MLDLSGLSPETRQLVQDTRYRAQVTTALLEGDPVSPEAMAACDAIDAAVVEILVAVGLPRGPINGPVIEHLGRGWFGRKAPDCTLTFDVSAFVLLPEPSRPDSIIRTWVHESIHARHPYAPSFFREWQATCGFEEGLAEGLARLVTVEWLGLRPAMVSYNAYVASYRALTSALEVDTERLWRDLWQAPAGTVSIAFGHAVTRILEGQGRERLSPAQRVRVSALSTRHFATDRANDQTDEHLLLMAWRSVLR